MSLKSGWQVVRLRPCMVFSEFNGRKKTPLHVYAYIAAGFVYGWPNWCVAMSAARATVFGRCCSVERACQTSHRIGILRFAFVSVMLHYVWCRGKTEKNQLTAIAISVQLPVHFLVAISVSFFVSRSFSISLGRWSFWTYLWAFIVLFG